MKLFTATQIQEWDRFTIERHYKDSSELMEVAASRCVEHIRDMEISKSYIIFCGTGNNGGDGLCIARMLGADEIKVTVYIAGDSESGSDDFKKNLQLILNTDIELKFLSEKNFGFYSEPDDILIDCLFGTGLNRAIEGWRADLIRRMNDIPNKKIAIDLPSGLLPDLLEMQQGEIVKADITLTFQSPKRAMLFQENFSFVGEFEVLSIGLDDDFQMASECNMIYYDELNAARVIRMREKFQHKNTFGHALIIAGSKGKMGAAIICAFSAMRSGAGLVTAIVPKCGSNLIQSVIPEVMCEEDEGENFLRSAAMDNKFSSVAIGPGIGQSSETSLMLRRILKRAEEPLILDADALNIIAQKNLHRFIPAGSILSPHVGEFDRLFGNHENSFDRFRTLRAKSVELNCIILLKGAHTIIAFPDGQVIFNSSGNAGMATAGSGDSLTGVLVSLAAQGYPMKEAACLAVFLHGLAGDIAAELRGETGMMARDIIESLPDAVNEIESLKKFSVI